MNSVTKNKDSRAKLERKLNEEKNKYYREKTDNISSTSDSSMQDLSCSDSYYLTSPAKHRSYGYNQRDDIAEQLSKLKIGHEDEKNHKNHSGTVNDATSEHDSKRHSIIAGKSPADTDHNSIASFADSRCSAILAGRLYSKDFIDVHTDDHSLLNMAINESAESSCANRSNNRELSHFVDSLEVQNEKPSFAGINEIDSLETEVFCFKNESEASENEKCYYKYNENIDPQSKEFECREKPRIISSRTVNLPLETLNQFVVNPQSEFPNSVLKDRNDNIEEISTRFNRTKIDFDSSITESEKLVVADVKTPNLRGILFIEDCHQSSPKIGVNVDTFGSEFITDISSLSMLGNADGKRDEDKKNNSIYRGQIVKRLSQQFAAAPTKFTEKLLTMLEESLQIHDNADSADVSGPNFSRLTEEFRKICQDYGPQIEDQSVCPDLYFTFSDVSRKCYSKSIDPACEVTPLSPLHSFSRLGGGKKVYRKTPKRICHVNNKVRLNHANSPNRALDNTENFEFWENLCHELSPLKQPKSKLSHLETSGVITHEELIRKSDEQMASLEDSIQIVESEYCERNSSTTSKDCQDHSNVTRQKFIEDLWKDKIIDSEYIKIEKLLSTRIVEKRRKCFEEARKVFEANQSAVKNENSESFVKNESKEQEDEARFLSTLSACVDYFDHVKVLQNHRNSLHCIIECSEDSKLTEQSTDDSAPIKFVQASILPAQNRVGYRGKKEQINEPEFTPNRSKFISKAYLDVAGSPSVMCGTPRRTPRRSPSRSISPVARPASVVTKKGKSPASQRRRRSSRAVKPASHASVPRTPSGSPRNRSSHDKQKTLSTPRLICNNNLKLGSDSPGLTDVTNIKKSVDVPKLIFTNSSPSSDSENCQNKLNSHGTEEIVVKKKYFYTPGKTPICGRARPKKKYFETPKRNPIPNKLPTSSPGHRVNYNTIQSPVGLYIRGTDPNLIKNVRGKTNERMLTPRADTPNTKSKVSSPILAHSPCRSPKSEISRLKFMLTPVKKIPMTQDSADILNIALCESDPSYSVGSESTSNSPFPKIFYKPAPCVKMVEDNLPQRRGAKVLMRGTEEKIIYRHEGRLKSDAESRKPNFKTSESTNDSLSCDSADVSLLHQRPAGKSNYLWKK